MGRKFLKENPQISKFLIFVNRENTGLIERQDMEKIFFFTKLISNYDFQELEAQEERDEFKTEYQKANRFRKILLVYFSKYYADAPSCAVAFLNLVSLPIGYYFEKLRQVENGDVSSYVAPKGFFVSQFIFNLLFTLELIITIYAKGLMKSISGIYTLHIEFVLMLANIYTMIMYFTKSIDDNE